MRDQAATHSSAEAKSALSDYYATQLFNGATQKEAFASSVQRFNLRHFDTTFAALLQFGQPVDELESSDWPEGYPISPVEHAQLQGGEGLSASVSLTAGHSPA